jgi:hypothetical protein
LTAAYPNSTTWKQKNITHSNHRIRNIFRFDQQSFEFKTILSKQQVVKKLIEEETKETSA